jgi:ribosomal protein L24
MKPKKGTDAWPDGARFAKNEWVKIVHGRPAGKTGTVLSCYRSKPTQLIYVLDVNGAGEEAHELELELMVPLQYRR